MKIFYLPLEPLPERYTLQLSAPKEGWLERKWIEYNVNYERIEGEKLTDTITQGQVLDANGRGYWATSQIQKLLAKIDNKEVTSDDVIFFDDFWHPGISALPYSFDQIGVRPKMYAQCYAQSVDPFDFTHPMRHWMRPFEQGIGKVLDGIFVASTCLKDMLVHAGIGTEETVHVTGLLFNSEEVKSRWPAQLPIRKKQVIYSSRWDKEKKPKVFLEIIDQVMRHRQDINFVITTSAEKLRSNDPELLHSLYDYLQKYPNNLELREGQTKEQYYENLLESRIQINTADQDFVSFTLLEATTCGCRTLYPYFLSFPEALEYQNDLMYHKDDAKHAAAMILANIDEIPGMSEFDWVYAKYDKTWERQLAIMEGYSNYDKIYSN